MRRGYPITHLGTDEYTCLQLLKRQFSSQRDSFKIIFPNPVWEQDYIEVAHSLGKRHNSSRAIVHNTICMSEVSNKPQVQHLQLTCSLAQLTYRKQLIVLGLAIYHSSTSLYLTLLHSTMVLYHSIYFILPLLYFSLLHSS